MKIEVEASALDKIKAMCERLQAERDELLKAAKKCVSAVNWRAGVYCAGESEKFKFADDKMWESIDGLSFLIAKCTQEQPVSDWQDAIRASK